MRYSERVEKAWEGMAEKYVTLPGVSLERAEEVGRLLADAFQPIFPWERGESRRRVLSERAHARRRLRELIEAKFPDSLP